MNRTRETVLNAASSYLRFGVSLITLFFLTPLFLRTLGRDGFGLWSLVFSVLGVVALLDSGLHTSLVKYVAECRGRGDIRRRNQIVSSLTLLYLGVALMAVVLVALTTLIFDRAFSIPESQRQTAVHLIWVLGARVVFLGLPLGIFRGLLFGEQKIFALNLIQSISTIVYALMCWFALGSGGGLVALAWINLSIAIGEHLAYALYSFHAVPGLRIALGLVAWSELREIVAFSKSQLVVNVASLVRLRSDPFVVKLFLPLDAVAIYAVGLKVAEQLFLLVKQGINVLAPFAAELQGQGEGRSLRPLLIKATKYALAPAIAVAVLGHTLGREAIVFWLGGELAGAAPVLTILLVASVLATIETTASSLLAMTGHHRPTSRAAALSAMLNIALSVLLVQTLGLVGVALATLVSGLVVDAILIPRLACRAYGITIRAFMGEVIRPAAIPGLVEYAVLVAMKHWLQPSSLPALILIGTVGAAAYVIAFACLAVEPDEWRFFSDLLSQKLPGLARRVRQRSEQRA